REVFLFGTLEMAGVGLFFGAILAVATTLPLKVAPIIGGAIALSSTAIVLKILNEKREIGKPYGQVVMGILLFQDLAVIPLLIAISILSNQNTHLLLHILIKSAIGFLGLGLFTFLYGKYLAPPLIGLAIKSRSDEIFMIAILVVALTTALVAHLFGLSYTLGAFLGGMVLSETPYRSQIEADLIPFRDLLLGIFFISVGFNIHFQFLISHWVQILLVTAGVIGGKIFLIYSLLRLGKVPHRVSLKSAFALSQIGEFAFVIFSLLAENRLAPMEILEPLMISGVISMILTPLILNNIYKIADFFAFTDRNPREFYNFTPAEVEGHIIIIGYDKIGQSVARRLTEKGVNYIAIEKQLDLVEEGLKNGDNVIFGNGADAHLLRGVSLDRAKAVIITTQNEEHTHLLLDNIRRLNRDVKVIALTGSDFEESLYSHYPNLLTINSNRLLAKSLIETIFRELRKEDEECVEL
ncbi:MAG: cation:proton antiporter, partial [Campylobacterales bacterium]